jgi:peptidoglycan-N-acetylglucosamine deacetylase
MPPMRAAGLAAATAGTAAAAAWTLPGLAPHVPALARALGIPRALDGDERAVALTFDDGPHPEGTPAVLEILRDRGAVATFFLVGEDVERRPSLAAEIAAAGHEIAVHGHRHRNLMRVSPRATAADLDRAAATIAAATGRPLRLYRPPYGIFTPAALRLVRARGWTPLLWSRWGADWRARTTSRAIATRATRDIEAGDVVLLHDADTYSARGSHLRTAAALPLILDALAARGLGTTTAGRF